MNDRDGSRERESGISVLAVRRDDEAESQLHNLEQAGRAIGLHVNANKTGYMCFKQESAISTLSGKPRNLLD